MTAFTQLLERIGTLPTPLLVLFAAAVAVGVGLGYGVVGPALFG